MAENEDTQVKTSLEIALDKPEEEPKVLETNRYNGKPIFPSKLIKKQMCYKAMRNKEPVSPFADADCKFCHGSGIMNSYVQGGQNVRKVCQCIWKVLNYVG